VRFLGHLAAVSLTVAVVVALGVAWAHAGGGSGPPGRDRRGPRQAPPVAARQLAARQAGRRAAGFNLGNVQDLERTIMIETVLVIVVVAGSGARRQRQRARRRALSA
jgi:hypothetical protein